MSVTTEKPAGTAVIRPFTIPIAPEAEIEALRARIAATRWPDKELVADHSQGPRLVVMQELARYWATEYDWRRCEAKLSALPHFMTEIDRLDIHFIHVRSAHEHALPVIITHGWPGSVIELLAVIDPLTNPTAHGASASDAFDVVIPSMPGYGYSGKPRETGWGPDRVARAWTELMKRLGYAQFVAQGGDWGAIVTDVMAAQAPPELLGMHTNMAGVVPPDVSTALARNVLGAGGPPPSGLSADESRTYEQLNFFYTNRLARVPGQGDADLGDDRRAGGPAARARRMGAAVGRPARGAVMITSGPRRRAAPLRGRDAKCACSPGSSRPSGPARAGCW